MTKLEKKNPLLEDMDNESMLYLSSNWSTGILEPDTSLFTLPHAPLPPPHHSQSHKNKQPILPKFDIQLAIDYPRSDFDSEE